MLNFRKHFKFCEQVRRTIVAFARSFLRDAFLGISVKVWWCFFGLLPGACLLEEFFATACEQKWSMLCFQLVSKPFFFLFGL